MCSDSLVVNNDSGGKRFSFMGAVANGSAICVASVANTECDCIMGRVIEAHSISDDDLAASRFSLALFTGGACSLSCAIIHYGVGGGVWGGAGSILLGPVGQGSPEVGAQ